MESDLGARKSAAKIRAQGTRRRSETLIYFFTGICSFEGQGDTAEYNESFRSEYGL
jgi:hypothetical protein